MICTMYPAKYTQEPARNTPFNKAYCYVTNLWRQEFCKLSRFLWTITRPSC